MYYNIYFYLTSASSGVPEDDDGGGIHEINETYSNSSKFILKVDGLAMDSGSIETSTSITDEAVFSPVIT